MKKTNLLLVAIISIIGFTSCGTSNDPTDVTNPSTTTVAKYDPKLDPTSDYNTVEYKWHRTDSIISKRYYNDSINIPEYKNGGFVFYTIDYHKEVYYTGTEAKINSYAKIEYSVDQESYGKSFYRKQFVKYTKI